MISTKEVDEAFHFLNDTIEEFARAKSYLSGMEKKEKTLLSQEVLESMHKSLGMKEAEARTSNIYRRWIKEYTDAVYSLELIRTKRRHSEMIWERWRSEFSAQKQGIAL